MSEISQSVTKDEFLVNFSAKHIIDGLSPFRKKWSIIVLMEFKNNKIVTFQNLQQKFSISPSVLSSTFKELTSEKLISRKAFGETLPMRVEYRLTRHGTKMMVALSGLIKLISESKTLK